MAKVLSPRNLLAALLLAGYAATNGTASLAAPPAAPADRTEARPVPESDSAAPGSTCGEAAPPVQPHVDTSPPYSSAEIADPDVEETWRPQLSISPPLRWRTVPYEKLEKGDYSKVVDAKHDASIVIRSKPSKGSADEDARRARVQILNSGLGWQVSDISQMSKDGSYVEFDLLSADGKRMGHVAVRHYGKDGHVSVVFIGSWPKESAYTSDPDYRGFVNATSLLSDK